MSKISNAITMAELLSNGRKYSIEELSDSLEVTPRMIRIYKDELEKAGIYIESIRGPYGGYVLKEKAHIPNRTFNYGDIKSLKEIKVLITDELLKNNLSVIVDKLNRIYNEGIEFKSDLVDETLSKYNTISRAIKEKRKLLINYYSFNKGENERIIHPYNLFNYNNGWGVAAYCEYKNDLRHFELKRILEYKLLDEFY